MLALVTLENEFGQVSIMQIYKYLIVCPLLFVAGLIDAIGGGGGLISLPAFMLAGLPVHQAIGTNKCSSTCGTALTTWRFIKNKLVDIRMSIPCVIAALIGSSIGANLSLYAKESVIEKMLIFVLPIVALIVLNRSLIPDTPRENVPTGMKLYVIVSVCSFFLGCYDGFYGPGTGTFAIIVFSIFAGLQMEKANAQGKMVNLATNATSFVVFIINGQVDWALGIAAAVFNMAGGYIGAGLAVSKGSKITRPVIILVLVIFVAKIVLENV